MALEIHVLAQPGPLPTLRWQWDAETDILTGTVDAPSAGAGYTGTVELNDDDGSIAVLDVNAGVLCGIDIVVWPEITTLAGLAAPVEARRGQVLVPSRTAKRGVAALEFDTTLTVSADPDERTFHLRIGTRRPVEPIRVADHFLVEVDGAQRLAGFWLEDVPQPPGLE
ncbi:MAG TPA: hypothetical protein VGL65_09355 [Gemmatimonadales bacterium]|jgi:hypothetical protein